MGINPTNFAFRATWKVTVGALFFWTVTLVGLLLWALEKENISVERLATMEARANFNKDSALRNWMAKRGGVYVQIDRGTPPNPYLDHIPERDIQTPSGKQLTLVNPAYMLRQTMNEFSELYGIKGRITSLKPLNKINEPDEWEREVLHAFDRDELEEKWEIGDINGKPHLRYMQAFYTKKACLKCHKHQGYQVGDVRGGIGVSIPLTPYLKVKGQTIRNLQFSYCGIWLLGIIGIGFGNHFARRRIIQQQEVEEALSVSKERFQDLVESTSDWIWELNNGGNFTYASPRVKEILGYEPEELVGKMTRFDLMPPMEAEDIRKQYSSFAAAAEPFDAMTNVNLHKNGHKVVMESSGRPFFNAEGKLLGYRGIDRDITERKQAEAELERLVTHDPLTGLYNRKALDERLTSEIIRATRYDRPLSIFALDIDHFKQVNDTHGHQAGDAVLRSFAEVINKSIRNMDCAARYGGEEFLVILPETPLSNAKNLAERLRSKIAENHIQIEKNKVLNVTASIGVATFPKHAKSWRDLLKVADIAMYAAKKNGRNRVHTADNSKLS